MSIPQICPSCGEHISGSHAKDCCFGTPEYAHIGWPSHRDDIATATRRLFDYLYAEPEPDDIVGEMVSNFAAITFTLLKKRAEELRREAAGISLVESRAKRTFAADILDQIISELTE